MGKLLERTANQQRLLDAWAEVRRRLQTLPGHEEELRAFERSAARRLAIIAEQLRSGRWRPGPVSPVVIPKHSGGVRQLGVPDLEDRIVERSLLSVLDPLVDPELMPWSFAYRRGLGVPDAIDALIEARDQGSAWVVRGDFTDCFPSIPLGRLIERLGEVIDDPALVELVRLLVHRPIRGQEITPATGLHQGSSISPLLANLYLTRFDVALISVGLRPIRYADDFAIPLLTKADASTALAHAVKAAAAIGLRLEATKCSTRSFDEGVPFLGQIVSAASSQRARHSRRPFETTVYVVGEGGLLRSKGDRIRLERDGEVLLNRSFNRVRQVVLLGRTGMTTPFLHAAIQRGVDVVFLTGEGRYTGRLQPAVSANVVLRQAQFRRLEDPEFALELARRIVAGKITNLRAGLLRAGRRLSVSELTVRVRRLDDARHKALDAKTLNALLGTEGAATRDYFQAFPDILGDEWPFPGRRRRPPPDPVNALLSLGYTLLVNDAIAACELVGLDPYAGFLHTPQLGRPSLALDLLEELRPVIVDSVVIRCLHTGMLKGDQFLVDEGPPRSCRLTPAGLRTYLAAYERRMLALFTHAGTGRRVSYRIGLGLQARSLGEELLTGARRYEPIVWK